MADNIENLIIEHLKRFQAGQEDMKRQLQEVNRRLSNLESGQGTIIQHLGHLASADASQQMSIDALGERIDRIEKRLELA